MNGELPPPNRAIGWYRFIVWVMPSLILPALIFLGLGFAEETALAVVVVSGAAVLIAFGLLDARLSCHQRGIIPKSRQAGQGWKLATYLMLQIIVILPVMSIALIYAICSTTWHMNWGRP
jgi:hypothetical protein